MRVYEATATFSSSSHATKAVEGHSRLDSRDKAIAAAWSSLADKLTSRSLHQWRTGIYSVRLLFVFRHYIRIRPEEPLAVEVDHVVGVFGDPDFGFPGDV